jgi:hypothetical protein
MIRNKMVVRSAKVVLLLQLSRSYIDLPNQMAMQDLDLRCDWNTSGVRLENHRPFAKTSRFNNPNICLATPSWLLSSTFSPSVNRKVGSGRYIIRCPMSHIVRWWPQTRESTSADFPTILANLKVEADAGGHLGRVSKKSQALAEIVTAREQPTSVLGWPSSPTPLEWGPAWHQRPQRKVQKKTKAEFQDRLVFNKGDKALINNRYYCSIIDDCLALF